MKYAGHLKIVGAKRVALKPNFLNEWMNEKNILGFKLITEADNFFFQTPWKYAMGVGGAVRFLVVGTIGQGERPPRGQLWMEQCLTSLKYWPI